MKMCNGCKKSKELSEFDKDVTHKDGLKSSCKLCRKISSSEYYSKNTKKKLAYQSKYRNEHKEEMAKYQSTYAPIYRVRNKDKRAAYNSRWQKSNPGKVNATAMKHIASKLQATPKWLTKDQLEEILTFYVRAAQLTKTTGIPHEVDHIIPLQGKNVRGLHVPWNLQILTKSKNVSKGNRIK